MRHGLVVLLVGLALGLAGCTEGAREGATAGASPQPSATSGPEPAPRTARGEDGPITDQTPTATEILYLIQGLDEHRFSHEPPEEPMEHGGVYTGAAPCEVRPLPFFVLDMADPCWGNHYQGTILANHAAGDEVQVHVWLSSERPQDPITLEVWLVDDEGPLAQGNATGTAGLALPAGGGAMGCTHFQVDLVLPRALQAEQDLSLELRALHHYGGDCDGGGTDAGRIVIGLPGAPS